MSSATSPASSPPSLLVLLCITGGLCWLSFRLGPPVIQGEFLLVPSVVFCFAALFALNALRRVVELTTRLAEWWGSRTTTGIKAAESWARLKEYESELSPKRSGPFWGRSMCAKKRPLFIDFVSNALVLAPAGSGKGIYSVVPNAISIGTGKLVCDFKGELVCMLKGLLEKRGERVRILNPGGLWRELVGDGDSYNPLDIIAEDLWRPDGLRDVPDDLRELSAQILQEPAEKESENTYFREGGRQIIGFAALSEVMVDGNDATLASVALLLEDRQRLEFTCRWIAGVDLDDKPHPDGPFPIEETEWAQQHDPADVEAFAALVRARAKNLLALMCGAESRTFDSFITGAQQALAPFAFGRLAPAMGRSTFSMNELKEGGSVFIVADASRMEAYKPFMGLMQWCALTAVKRHSDKNAPVYVILDEATNYKVHGLESLLTWGRSYGLRLIVVFQDLGAFERVYGKAALNTLLSESEIKQLLPGQRSPRTLELISKQLLGEQALMSYGANHTLGKHQVSESANETSRPLMTPGEVRRAKHGILLVRGHRPIAFEPISYAEVSPWRKQVGINPFHGKPFRKKVKLWL